MTNVTNVTNILIQLKGYIRLSTAHITKVLSMSPACEPLSSPISPFGEVDKWGKNKNGVSNK